MFQKSIPAARHGRPSTARPHGPPWLTFETIGARKPCHLFQKSIPAARHDQPSTVRSHDQLWQTFEIFGVRNPPYHFFSKAHRSGLSRPSVHDPLSQPALTHIVEAIFIENCCFSKRIKPKIICNPDLIFGLAEHLVTMTLYTTIHLECATLTLHSNSGLSLYLALESTGVEWNMIEWSAKHTAPRKTWSYIIFLRLESF